MIEEPQAEGLATALWTVSNDPQLVSQLYRVLGEFCHKVRNQLNTLNLGLYLARKGDPREPRWGELEGSYREVERLIDHVQTICRPMSIAPVKADLGSLLVERQDRWSAEFEDRGLVLDWIVPKSPAIGQVDPSRLIDILDAWVGWRARSAGRGGTARLSWGTELGCLYLLWEEEGDRALFPCGDEAVGSPCLALPLLARIARAHGGAVSVSRHSGLRVSLRWPAEGPVPCL